jgi:eukaryotic-like serine/threonine-protein kinase
MSGRIRFGVYELDRDAMELRKHGVPIRLQEQPFRVLAMLAERPGEVITREQLQEQIWGNTFVDFDHSLNKAVNRLREALNDNAGSPQYVETVPRRGYRFIAPVAASPQTEAQGPTAPVSPGPAEGSVRPGSHRSPSQIVVLASFIMASVLAAIGLIAFAWLKKPTKPTLQEVRHTSFGWSPALSRDGKLLAYASGVGSEAPHIWLQQTAGGEAIPVTTGSDLDNAPDFSPDGTRIAFFSSRKGGGIYITSTLPAEPRLVVSSPDLDGLQFSPGGDSIVYWEKQKAFSVPVEGGSSAALPLDQDFRLHGSLLLAPDGKEILFYGVPSREQNKPADWWVAPLAGGQAKPAHFPGIEHNSGGPQTVWAWIRTSDQRAWIIYSTDFQESWKLWRIGVSPRGAIDDNPELLATGNGYFGPVAASADGQLAYRIGTSNGSIFQVSIGDRGQKLGPTFQLPLPESETHVSPSLSRDGKWMAYDTSKPGKPNTILLRDMGTGTDHLLDDKGRLPLVEGGRRETSISPDGSRVIFERDCKEGVFQGGPASPLPCGFMVAAAGGEPEQVCEDCTPRGFSSDGSAVLLQKYNQTDVNKDRIVALDLRTRTERNFLSLPDRPVFHPFVSWDDRWVVFKKTQPGDSPPSQIMIAPVRLGSAAPEAEWIPVTDGKHSDDKPQFSPDGNTVYFTSARDAYLCIWAQRLDPATKHPLGPPFAYEHFHNHGGWVATMNQGSSDLSVARDKMLINLPQGESDIWLTRVP